MPAPKKNRNALKHHIYATGVSSYKYIDDRIRKLRSSLEDEILAEHGELSHRHAWTIESVCKWDRHSALCLKWMRDLEDATPERLEFFHNKSALAIDKRNAALEKLDLREKVKERFVFPDSPRGVTDRVGASVGADSSADTD